MSQNPSIAFIADLIREHKEFAWRYLISLLLALFVLALASFLALISDGTTTGGFLAKTLAPKEAVNAVENGSIEANLSPGQWKELENLIKALPEKLSYLDNLQNGVDSRTKATLGFSDFVFYHYDAIPEQTRSDFQTLAELEESKPDQDTFPQNWRQLFVTETLSALEVKQLLDLRSSYESDSHYCHQATILTDRIVPVLINKGLNISQNSSDPKPTLNEFLGVKDSEKIDTAPELPALSFSIEQVVAQLTKSSLSQGDNSAERARSAPQ